VYRGHGEIVIDDASMQLPLATVEVTHMGSMAEAEAAATFQPWERSEERTAVNLAAFAASRESKKAQVALHAAKLKVPQRYTCDHEGCAKSYSEKTNLTTHKRKAHPAS
jgi:hypothetical protein